MRKRRRAHPITPRERAVLDELRAWGEQKIELEHLLDAHWQSLVPLAKRALEVGISTLEMCDQTLVAKTTLERRLTWRPADVDGTERAISDDGRRRS